MSSTTTAPPDRVRVFPAASPLRGRLRAQPSKNYAARWLWTSALREGTTRLAPLPSSDDARAMIACCEALGATIRRDADAVEIEGFGGRPSSPATLNPGNAGAVLRFAMGAAALGGEFRFETAHADSLGQRPNRHLLDALGSWGADILETGGEDGRLPVALRSALGPGSPDLATVRGEASSQFLSSLLMAAPARARRLGRPQTIRLDGELRSRPAVETTLEVMAARGVRVAVDEGFSRFEVPPADYAGDSFAVNGDWPSAAAILCAAAAVPGSEIEIEGLQNDSQGERRVAATLREAGCSVEWLADGALRLKAPKRLKAFRFDVDLAADAAPALTALAALCDGESVFERAGTLRLKECDRIAAPLAELWKVGVLGEGRADSYSVFGQSEGLGSRAASGLALDGHADHRLVMMAAILALRAQGPLCIDTASHVAKSYPGFFDDLAALGVRSEQA